MNTHTALAELFYFFSPEQSLKTNHNQKDLQVFSFEPKGDGLVELVHWLLLVNWLQLVCPMELQSVLIADSCEPKACIPIGTLGIDGSWVTPSKASGPGARRRLLKVGQGVAGPQQLT